MFGDNSALNISSISFIIYALSDHNTEILTTESVYSTIKEFPLRQTTILINNEVVMNIQTLLKQ